jgi:hypothetical protein
MKDKAMSLSAPVPRRHMHVRTVQCDGYHREDGLWDIEASIIDRKPFRYVEPVRGAREIGSDVHHMAIRLTLGEDFVIRAIEVVMPSTPYPSCIHAVPNYQGLVGRRIDRTWRATVREVVGLESGCTHARELLFPMATTAFQTLTGWREGDSEGQISQSKDQESKPPFVGDCMGWATDGPIVARFYPKFSTAAGSDLKNPAS